jgi:ligand-binding SRPBCC domain-containing protein
LLLVIALRINSIFDGAQHSGVCFVIKGIMSKVHELRTAQRLPVSLEEAWAFFSHPKNLAVVTPDELNLRFTNELYGAEAYAGQIITYTVRPLLGIPVFWLTEITHLEHGRYFVDEQRRGPYAMWHHQHHFRQIPGGVEMTDIVHYQLPFYPFGELALPSVKKKLKAIFDFRYRKTEEVLGKWQEPVLSRSSIT